MLRLSIIMSLAGLLLAQEPAQNPQPAKEKAPDYQIIVHVENILAPTLVFDRDGNFVNGLSPDQFHLLDNGKEQNIHVDVAYQPISMVILVQANAAVEKMLPAINKIGNMIQPIILGVQGEAAVIAFDHRIRTLAGVHFRPRQDHARRCARYTRQQRQPHGRRRRTGHLHVEPPPIEPPPDHPFIGETRDIGSEARGAKR